MSGMSVFFGVLGLLVMVAVVVYEMIQERRLEAADREWLRK